MAEEIIFKTSVDTGTTAKDLKAIDKELGNIDKTTKSASTDLNKTFDDLNARVESGTMTMRESTKAIKEYQTIALQAGRESPIGKEAIARGAALQDKIVDLRNEITRASHDGKNMQAALQLGSTITAGYGALTGAQALLGSESENLTKTLVKLQAVQAILASIEEVRAALEKESFLMQKAKVIQTNILSAATAAYTTVVGASTGAMKAARIAMLAIPIVALVAGVAALVATFAMLSKEVNVNLTGAIKAVTASMTEYLVKLNLINEAQNKVTDRALKNLDQEAKRRIAMGEDSLKVQREINLEKIKEIEIALKQDEMAVKALKTQKERLIETQKETNEKIKQAIIDEEKAQKDMIWTVDIERSRNRIIALKQQEKIVDQELQKSIYNTSKEITKRKDEVQSEKDAIEDLKTSNIELGNEIRNQNKKTADDKKALNAQELEAYKRQQEELRGIQEAEDAWVLNQELSAEEAKRIKDEKQRADEELNSAFKIGIWEHELAEEKRIEEEKVKAHQETNDAKVKIAEMGAKSLNDLAGAVFAVSNAYGKQDEKSKEDRARKQFKVMKALSLATAVVDGIQTTMAAFRNGMSNPIPLLGPATAAVYAGAAAITSAANIAKISATNYEGGGGGSVPSVAPPSSVPNTPNPQLANADTTLTSGLSGGNNNQGGGKVFVVDSEITAKQNQSAQVLSIATVG